MRVRGGGGGLIYSSIDLGYLAKRNLKIMFFKVTIYSYYENSNSWIQIIDFKATYC